MNPPHSGTVAAYQQLCLVSTTTGRRHRSFSVPFASANGSGVKHMTYVFGLIRRWMWYGEFDYLIQGRTLMFWQWR